MEFVIIILLVIACGLLTRLVFSMKNKEQNNSGELLNTLQNQLQQQLNNVDTNVISRMGQNNESLIERFGKLQIAINNEMNRNNEKLVSKFNEVDKNLTKSLNEFNNEFKKGLDNNIDKLMSTVESKLNHINDQVENRLKIGFEQTNQTFSAIIERLSKIDEAQKNIEALSTNVVSLQDILTDKKSRGTFGEVQLYNVLSAVLGEPGKLYKTQHSLGNGTICDAILFTPEPTGDMVIDSKFPLENYRKSVDFTASEAERKTAQIQLKKDVKKHIDDISTKYIISGVTSDQAVLFLPAEAVFAELHAYYPDVIEYAQSKHIWIASPTTLIAILTVLQTVVKDIEREKYSKVIVEHLSKLSEEFDRYKKRWEVLAKDIDKVTKGVKEINTTSQKISKKFKSISEVQQIERIEYENIE